MNAAAAVQAHAPDKREMIITMTTIRLKTEIFRKQTCRCGYFSNSTAVECIQPSSLFWINKGISFLCSTLKSNGWHFFTCVTSYRGCCCRRPTLPVSVENSYSLNGAEQNASALCRKVMSTTPCCRCLVSAEPLKP